MVHHQTAITLVSIMEAVDNVVEASDCYWNKGAQKTKGSKGNGWNAVWAEHVEGVRYTCRKETAATEGVSIAGARSAATSH